MTVIKLQRILPALIVCLSLAILPAHSVQAVDTLTFNVDSFGDKDDFAPGNSVCSTGSVTGGPCTLRAAVVEASLNQPYYNIVINLPPGIYILAIPPSGNNDYHSGDLNFPATSSANTITIQSTGTLPAVIDAQQIDRVFNVGYKVPLTLINLVIRGGFLASVNQTQSRNGAGITNEGFLNLQKVVLENNSTICGTTSCAYVIGGGAVMNYGNVYMLDSTIQNNSAVTGSAIFNTAGGDFKIRNSTVFNNHALSGYVISNWATLSIRNSTIYQNSAPQYYYSGIANNGSGQLAIESSTIANGEGLSGILNASGATVSMQDSILSVPPGGMNCYIEAGSHWNSGGYNIFSEDSCLIPAAGDLVYSSPMLGNFGWWGGPTLTMPPLPGSPALNHRPGLCVVTMDFPTIPPQLDFDQRHFARSDGSCDTGAVEGVSNYQTIYLPLVSR